MTMFPVYVVGLLEVILPPVQAVVTPTDYGFYQQLSTAPARTKANPGAFSQFVPQHLVPTPATWDFHQPLSAPPVKTRANVGPAHFFGQPPATTVATPNTYGFYAPLSTVPVKRTVSNSGPAVFYTQRHIVTTPTQYGFFQPLSLPPKVKQALLVGGISRSNNVPAAPVITPTQFGFFQPLSCPPSRPALTRCFAVAFNFGQIPPVTPSPWTPVPPVTETWTPQTASTDIWTPQIPGSTTWIEQ